jgi:hypothetical protein
VRFATPWRHHVIFPALLLALILWAAYFGLRGSCGSGTGKLARGVFIWVTLVGPIAWIGLFEGGYNHALKVILFQLDLPVSTLQRLYPPGLYEPPEDLFFEATGVE